MPVFLLQQLHQAPSRFSADNGGDRQDLYCLPSSESVALEINNSYKHKFFHLNPQKSKKMKPAIFSCLDGKKSQQIEQVYMYIRHYSSCAPNRERFRSRLS